MGQLQLEAGVPASWLTDNDHETREVPGAAEDSRITAAAWHFASPFEIEIGNSESPLRTNGPTMLSAGCVAFAWAGFQDGADLDRLSICRMLARADHVSRVDGASVSLDSCGSSKHWQERSWPGAQTVFPNGHWVLWDKVLQCGFLSRGSSPPTREHLGRWLQFPPHRQCWF